MNRLITQFVFLGALILLPGCGDGSGAAPIAGKIAFGSGRDVNNQNYVMNADGTNKVCLLNNDAYELIHRS